MYRKLIAALATLGLALGLALVAPAVFGTEPQAQAAGEFVGVGSNSRYGTQVRVSKSDGGTSYIGVLPGGYVVAGPGTRFNAWYLPAGRCAYFTVNGESYQRTGSGGSNAWVYISPGAAVAVDIRPC